MCRARLLIVFAIQATLEDLKALQAQWRATATGTPSDNPMAHGQLAMTEYMISLHGLGENTLANAKKLGYLDAHELYPDVPQRKLEDFAAEWYAME